ncbi:TIGR02186 family protein [Blastomonas sp. AAP53]|uniref:TIGR02186 family protein n=1 Tax=Blastomonas sp. AAP53 TaxID=1248760 RepID=UPI0003789A0F|nr:TIGR02186 family protein [Blastomonas sp. AAP53]
MRWLRVLPLVMAVSLLTAATEPVLVPEVSQRDIQIQYGFTGAELLLFGAIVYPGGTPPSRDSDIVVILKGPPQSIILREKQKIAGIWINAASTEFRSAPGYYAVASSRPIEKIVDKRTAAIYEFGLSNLQLSPAGSIDPAEQRRFLSGLVDLNTREGLYKQQDGSVEILEGVLYQARLSIPASVPTGTYTAETFLVRDGQVLAAAVREIEVRKFGFELFVAAMAEYQPFLYGVSAVLISLALGWLGGVLFRKV